MNELIELDNDRQLRIVDSNKRTRMSLECAVGGIAMTSWRGGTWEPEFISALLDALHCFRDTGSFAALAKVRPYTPVEAAAHLGRKVDLGGVLYKAASVDESGVRFESHGSWAHINYAGLAGDSYAWADDGTPCGVVEQPQ